jgi:Icc-related predicted phosphoesterase
VPSRTLCFFASDLHGRSQRYRRLFELATAERPAALFLGGDLLPHALASGAGGFLHDVLEPGLLALHDPRPSPPTRVLVVLGNDDPRCEEPAFRDLEARGLIEYIHGRQVVLDGHPVYGYAFVPPTPFLLKDWERYDVSRFVDPGCISPEEGRRTVPQPEAEVRWGTIEADLRALVGEADLARAVFLFHSPPYGGALDRAALDGRKVEHAPLDLHVGSVAIRRFIEARQPLLTLHGHIHESARLSGAWREQVGRTWCLSAAHDGPELALVRFELEDPEAARRELL